VTRFVGQAFQPARTRQTGKPLKRHCSAVKAWSRKENYIIVPTPPSVDGGTTLLLHSDQSYFTTAAPAPFPGAMISTQPPFTFHFSPFTLHSSLFHRPRCNPSFDGRDFLVGKPGRAGEGHTGFALALQPEDDFTIRRIAWNNDRAAFTAFQHALSSTLSHFEQPQSCERGSFAEK